MSSPSDTELPTAPQTRDVLSSPCEVHSRPSGPQSSPARLAIQRLCLENFKSYGGRVEVGPFHKSFSSIVGPNGSGKSNVIDAMLFVFGRRAKQLRHSKMSELLHHSTTYPNVSSATVTVYFHEIIDTGPGDEDFTVVTGSSFAVARRAFRNDTSKYYLDGKEVKMGTVVALLKAKGVDLDNNRFLILQGEVEQIAMMKPKAVTAHEDGLLEYLEDIIGSNRHIEAIEEASAKVESLNEERGHKLNRVKAAERERDALEGAKVEAEDYLDKERDMLTKRIKLSKALQYEKNVSLKEHLKEQEEAQGKIDAFQIDVREKEETVKSLEQSFVETQRSSDLAVKTMNEAKDKYTSFERRDIKLREDLKALKAKEKRLKGVRERETKRAEDSAKRAEECLQEKKDSEEKLKDLESSLKTSQAALDKIREEVRTKTAPIRQKLEEKQTELLPYSESVNKCRKDLEVNQSELQLMTEKVEAPKKALEDAKLSLGEMEASLHNAKEAHSSLENEKRENNRILRGAEKAMQHTRNALHTKTASCSEMRRKVEEAKSAREFVHTRSRLHSAILAAGRSGALPGVVGRLGDLASVDSKYSTAVGAAAGANLDCIVVRSAENAQACIQFLRRENLGRATFVILEKVEYLQSSIAGWSRSDRGSDGPRLFDFLTIPNPQNRNAIYYALRDTLVADSLEEARRMAFKPTRQNRVVTLAGELIESSGAMTGGGRGPTRYKLGSGNADREMDPRELQNLCQQLDSVKQSIQEEEESLRGHENNHKMAVSRLEQLGVQFTKAKLEITSLESRITYMKGTTLPELSKTAQEVNRNMENKRHPEYLRREKLKASVMKSEAILAEARGACEDLEAEISALQDKIVAVGGSELQTAKENVDRIRQEMSEEQSSSAKAVSRATAAEKASDKAHALAETAGSDIENVRKEIIATKEQSESMLDDAEQVLLHFKETEKVNDEWAEKLHTVQAEYTSIKNQLKQLRREEVTLREAADTIKRLVSQETSDLRALQKQEMATRKKLMKVTSSASAIPTNSSTDKDGEGEMEDSAEKETNETQEASVDVEMEEGAKEEDKSEDEKQYELSAQDKTRLSREITMLESELSNLNPNLSAIEEYQKKDMEYKGQVNDLDNLTSSRDEIRRECDSLRKARLDEFMAGFGIITLKLKELYQMITLGGDAELELVDSLDPFSEGIVFSVRPPKKSWKNISNLSGGEKTLSSLALVFALHHFKPTPLYFLDEIDAALDYKNVSIVANYVKERTKNAQFIIISLRNNMFELADRLVGIYKTHNTTKSVTVDPAAFVIPAVAK